MQPEGSLPHSQVPATCPYPAPAWSSSYPPTSHFLKIHFNIILPSTSWSLKWSLSLRFPHQNPVYASPLPHTRYMPRPSQTTSNKSEQSHRRPWIHFLHRLQESSFTRQDRLIRSWISAPQLRQSACCSSHNEQVSGWLPDTCSTLTH